MWHGKIFYGKCYLVVVGHSSTYKIVKVISAFKKIVSKPVSGTIFTIIMIYFYNYSFIYFLFLLNPVLRLFPPFFSKSSPVLIRPKKITAQWGRSRKESLVQ